MFRYFNSDLKKCLSSPAFYISILATFLLCLFSETYYDETKNINVSTLTIWIDILLKKRNYDVFMSAYYLADHALRVWPAMFLPVLVGFCYIPLFCDEQESGALRHEIIRTKPVLFWASRYILASVVGGVIILSGFLLYVIFVYIFWLNHKFCGI